MKRKIGLAAAAACVYILLLIVLVCAESSCAQSQIHSFSDALWYSLVTITTVGYGDLYPVSAAGRAVGAFFLLLSVGFLAFVISAVYRLLSGHFLPLLSLYMHRTKPWLLFSQVNCASAALAENLAKTYPDAMQVFCCVSETADVPDVLRQKSRVFVRRDIGAMLAYGGRLNAGCTAFLIAQEELINSDDAYALCDRGAMLYCCSQEGDRLEHVSYFQPDACCARQYWQNHPIREAERCILLVGDGRYAQAMLSSAIVTNCRTPLLTAEYHLFGDWDAYRRLHFCLSQALAIDCREEGKDALFFHAQAWNDDAALIEHADRIIFCSDDEDENARMAQMLERSYVCSAAAYVRTPHQSAPGIRFGEKKDLYTAEMVMKQELDRRAKQMHEQYRQGTGNQAPAWEELDAFFKESNRAVADHAATKIRMLLRGDAQINSPNCRRAAARYREASEQMKEICRHNEHDRWLRFYSLHNWRYAPQRDDKKRRHPCIVPYDQLGGQEQAKDDYAWMQLELLAGEPDIQEKI